MANFQQQLTRSKQITPDILSAELFAFIKSISKYLIALNKEQINKNSEDIFGNAIGFYSRATEIISGGKKQWGDPFTGKDTGDWFKGFYMLIENESILFSSTDKKNELILSSAGYEFADSGWLSSDLFGLTDENLKIVIEKELKPFLINYSRKSLAL